MKKIYTKPSLLSETFVAENIMTGEEEKKVLSTAINLYLNGETFTGVEFNGSNTLATINYSLFNK